MDSPPIAAVPPARKRRWFQFSLLGLLIVVTVVAVVCGYALSVVRSVKAEENNRRARHVEATKTIRQVYAAFQRDGRWPTDEVVAAGSMYALPAEWKYVTDGSGAFLYLQGGFHMTICYRFEAPRGQPPTKIWTFDCEGDESEFETTESYAPDAAR